MSFPAGGAFPPPGPPRCAGGAVGAPSRREDTSPVPARRRYPPTARSPDGSGLVLYDPDAWIGIPVFPMDPSASRRYLPCGSWELMEERRGGGGGGRGPPRGEP